MPRFARLGRRAGPLGLALTAVDLWRKIPPEHRRELVAAARKHGPKLAAKARKAAKRRAPKLL